MIKIEDIFRTIPAFKDIEMDKILFESFYPVMFTCVQNDDIFLFICCYYDSTEIKWIGTETSYPNLIDLLTDKITIREAFTNITTEKFLIIKNVNGIVFDKIQCEDFPQNLLPTEGEFMDVDPGEFDEEIDCFKNREKQQKVYFMLHTLYELNNINRESFTILKPTKPTMLNNYKSKCKSEQRLKNTKKEKYSIQFSDLYNTQNKYNDMTESESYFTVA